MKANELRIGNLIELPSFNGTGENIVADLNYHIFACNATCIRDAEYYGKDWAGRAIELTPEILIEVGFTERSNSHGTYYHIKHKEFGGYAYDLDKKCISTDYPAACNGFCSLDIEYLHQLQNLYFALTGEELTLKQKP